LRLFELGTVYRYERAGTLHGLMRIRGFTQDDSTSTAPRSSWPTRSPSLLDFVLSVLRAFGFDEFTFNLSTKDPDKYVGSDDIWDKATAALREALDRHGLEYKVKEGDAPSTVRRSTSTCATPSAGRGSCRPSRPTSTCRSGSISSTSAPTTAPPDHAPPGAVRLDRAVLRCAGRALRRGVPDVARPAAGAGAAGRTAHEEYAAKVVAQIAAAGGRVDMVAADDQLGKRIRASKLEKIPYMLVVGDDDVAAGTVGVNPRGGDVERGVSVDEFVRRFTDEVQSSTTAALTA
jgi:threonyl-tRNA synthetase